MFSTRLQLSVVQKVVQNYISRAIFMKKYPYILELSEKLWDRLGLFYQKW